MAPPIKGNSFRLIGGPAGAAFRAPSDIFSVGRPHMSSSIGRGLNRAAPTTISMSPSGGGNPPLSGAGGGGNGRGGGDGDDDAGYGRFMRSLTSSEMDDSSPGDYNFQGISLRNFEYKMPEGAFRPPHGNDMFTMPTLNKSLSSFVFPTSTLE